MFMTFFSIFELLFFKRWKELHMRDPDVELIRKWTFHCTKFSFSIPFSKFAECAGYVFSNRAVEITLTTLVHGIHECDVHIR